MKKRLAVAVSGSGRTLENLIRQQKNYLVVAVIVSNKSCRGYEIAKQANLPIFHHTFQSDSPVGKQLYEWLEDQNVEFVALGGFLKKFPVMPTWQNRIFNIHPALLPKYGGKNMYGMNVHTAVIAAGEPYSGATVHIVNERYDEGPIVSQATVKIAEFDTAATLADKVFKAECILYPLTLNEIANQGGFHPDQKIIRMEYRDDTAAE